MNLNYFYKLSLAFVLHFGNLNAQTITCDNFKIKHFIADSININTMQMGIEFQANTNQMVGYPYIPVITDCMGDTIAKGQMFYFGQIGNTNQDYPVELIKSNYCEPLNVTFIYLNENRTDTCKFIFGNSAKYIRPSYQLFEVFPNPTTGEFTLEFKDNIRKHHVELFDFMGSKVFSSFFDGSMFNVKLPELPSGQYILRADGTAKILIID